MMIYDDILDNPEYICLQGVALRSKSKMEIVTKETKISNHEATVRLHKFLKDRII